MTFHLTNPIVNPFFTLNVYINCADLDMSANLIVMLEIGAGRVSCMPLVCLTSSETGILK